MKWTVTAGKNSGANLMSVAGLSTGELLDSIVLGRRESACRNELHERDWTDEQIDRVVDRLRKDWGR